MELIAKELVAKELGEKRESVIQLMLATTGNVSPPEEQRQFVSGFIDLVIAAAQGNTTARDEYLEAVIPGCKSAGLEFSFVVATMVPVSMAFAATLSHETFPWCAAFCLDYTKRLIETWQKS